MSSTQTTHIWRPSSARSILLDGFVPVPRGTLARAPEPLSWPAKDPADVLDYRFDISAALSGNVGDAISTVQVTVMPAGAGDLVATSTAADGPTALVWFSGGNAGIIYTVQIAITTLSGRSISRAVLLPVVGLTNLAVPIASLTDELGATVTDQGGSPILIGE